MASGSAGCLITSPAHLSRLKGFRGLARIAAHCAPIFSSGGPVDRVTAVALGAAFAESPFEIFGSTETGGGLAPAGRHRRRGDVDALLQRGRRGGLRGAAARALALRERAGRRVHAGRPRRRARDGRFSAGPRGDRVVKVGDKRVSLPRWRPCWPSTSWCRRPLWWCSTTGRARASAPPSCRRRPDVSFVAARPSRVHAGADAAAAALLGGHPPAAGVALRDPVAGRRAGQDHGGRAAGGVRQPVRPGRPVAGAEVVDEAVSVGVVQQTLRVPEQLGCLTAISPSWPSCPVSRSSRGSWKRPARWPAPRWRSSASRR